MSRIVVRFYNPKGYSAWAGATTKDFLRYKSIIKQLQAAERVK
jgi:hypothetical protein